MDPRFEEAQELVSSLKTKCQLRKEKLLRNKQQQQQQLQVAIKENKNDERFENNYQQHHRRNLRSSSGRSSSNSASNSNESAFNSASEGEDSGETSGEEQSLGSSSTSGRSSANQSVDSASELSGPTAKQLNTICNLTPSDDLTLSLVESVRCKFLESLRADASDKYEQEDLAELEKGFIQDNAGDDQNQEQALSFRLISRFLNFKLMKELTDEKRDGELEKALDEALDRLKELLQFRHKYQLTLVLNDHFCKEIHMLHGIFPFGFDKNQLPVLYLRARVHRRWSRDLDESFRRYVAWQVNMLTKSYLGAELRRSIGVNAIEKDGSFGICFDCLNVSYSCVDMDFLNFLVKILVTYYPTYCRYALCVDLPWLFRSVWKIVRGWLPEDARNTVHLITSKQLTEFIDEEQIPNSIKVNDLAASEKPIHLRHKLPDNLESLKTIEQVANDLNLSSSETKQFKTHVGKVLKEYEQMGAI